MIKLLNKFCDQTRNPFICQESIIIYDKTPHWMHQTHWTPVIYIEV